jgi:beta-glucosidase
MMHSLIVGLLCSFLLRGCHGANVEALLASMSLEAKIGQMVQIDIAQFMVSGTSTVNYTLMNNYIQEYQIGSILNSPFSGGPVGGVTGWGASKWRELISQMQTFAQTTESKIPIIYGIDSIHGATYINGSALMPQAINLGATFNESLAYQAGLVTAKDTRAAGIPWIFAPVLGLGKFFLTFHPFLFHGFSFRFTTIMGKIC